MRRWRLLKWSVLIGIAYILIEPRIRSEKVRLLADFLSEKTRNRMLSPQSEVKLKNHGILIPDLIVMRGRVKAQALSSLTGRMEFTYALRLNSQASNKRGGVIRREDPTVDDPYHRIHKKGLRFLMNKRMPGGIRRHGAKHKASKFEMVSSIECSFYYLMGSDTSDLFRQQTYVLRGDSMRVHAIALRTRF
ncbi:hypothetical protein Tco_0643745 [Tanacetum coccineum]